MSGGTWRRTWRWPVRLAMLTAVGLGAALVGTGAWRWLAWTCLAVPIVAAMRALLANTHPPRRLMARDL